MKLIKQSALYYQEGRSDKVYEVDLCEVGGDQYVVNFRYGRRGTALRDGTKTIAPVKREQAERIFDNLVASKIGKGYVASESPAAIVDEEVITAEAADGPATDARRRAILDRLATGPGGAGERPLSRAVWRAGEMRLREAAPLLLRLIGAGDDMLDYCLAWSLAQCGSGESVAGLQQIQSNEKRPFHARRMAAEALLRVGSDAQRASLIAKYAQQMPAPLNELAISGPAEKFQEALLQALATGERDAFRALESIYLVDNAHVRPALLHVLRTAPLAPNYFLRMRRIFKSAEMRRDAEVFGIIAHRFETERANFRMQSQWYYPHRKKPTIGPDAERAFSAQTRQYMRRRVWRTLQRLGDLNDGDYVKMAVGVLLPFTDDDARSARQESRYDWSAYSSTRQYSTITIHWDRFAEYWAFSQVLYRNSPRYQAAGNAFQCAPPYEPGQPAPEQREEAFPLLWNDQPAALLHLLDDSRCEPVHEFAAKALRQCEQFCSQLDVAALGMLLAAPYEVTVQLGFDLAVKRYDPDNPDRQLVLALANCVVERARRQAGHWINAKRRFFFADNDFTVALVASPFADTRALARDALRTVALDDVAAKALIGRLIALLQTLSEGQGPLAADVAETLLRAFAPQMRTIGPEVIRDLLAHPLPEVQAFAGDLVLGHESLSRQPPEDIIRALLGAGEPSVRGIGVRIIGQLSDDVLRRSIDLLVALTRHELADIRNEIRPVVKRLTLTDSDFGRRIGARLVDELLVAGAPDGVPSHTARVLREDLREYLSAIPADKVWKLLQSRSGPAQEIGGLLLPTNVDANSLSVAEIVKLASHDILAVREASWRMCQNGIDRLRGAMTSTVRVLDAKWDDSRQFAFDLFRKNFDNGELTPEVLVSICDSVRDDVQQFGRAMITRRFQEEHGQEYLLKLSEHPAVSLQLFATSFLDGHAADAPERLRELEPYFVSVLSRVNRGRAAKDRVLAMLEREAVKSEEAARIAAGILTRISATAAIGDRARAIEVMLAIHTAFPGVALPLELQPVEMR